MSYRTLLHRFSLPLALSCCCLASCASDPSVPSVELFDERTALTMVAMPQPLAFAEAGIEDVLVPDKQPTLVYVGPVEWDRSGVLTYALWMQVAPGVGGQRMDDILAHGAVRMTLDDGAVELSAKKQPVLGNSPYVPIPPVGQTAFFPIDLALLQRMAASKHLALTLRTADLNTADFLPLQATPETLQQFMADRGIAPGPQPGRVSAMGMASK